REAPAISTQTSYRESAVPDPEVFVGVAVDGDAPRHSRLEAIAKLPARRQKQVVLALADKSVLALVNS
ncbi:MAG: hypothetical protein AAF658_07240, partial [Myxococcota bacterium]